MMPRFIPDLHDWSGGLFGFTPDAIDLPSPLAASGDGANEWAPAAAAPRPALDLASANDRNNDDATVQAPNQDSSFHFDPSSTVALTSEAGHATFDFISLAAATSEPTDVLPSQATDAILAHMPEIGSGEAAIGTSAHLDHQILLAGEHSGPSSSVFAVLAVGPRAASDAGFFIHGVVNEALEQAGYQVGTAAQADSVSAQSLISSADAGATVFGPLDLAHLVGSTDLSSDGVTTNASIGSHGATGVQVLAALGGTGVSVSGTGIKIGVISDSFNDLGGAAADEADGALPSGVQVLKDDPSGGTDEGRAMAQIVHDIAPNASLAFYTADISEQDFANGILALAAAGCKVISDDVGYFDEPFFQNGVVAQAIQTVEAEGVTYISAAGNDASNAYKAAWTPISGTFDGVNLTDAQSFGGSIVQTITLTASNADNFPLLLEWNHAFGAANNSNLEILIFHNGTLMGTATTQSNGDGNTNNPFIGIEFSTSGTYQIAIENLSGPNPGLIKEIAAGDGLPVTLSGANSGTVFGHAMTPGDITAGAVSAASAPAFGVSPPQSESFSSSGAGTELLFANNGTALSSPDLLNPVAVSGLDDISTTLPGGLSDFYGTSAASASLAGVAALILAADPNLTPAQVEQIMEETALPMSNASVSGAGLVQINAAVAAAAALAATVIEAFGATKLVQVGSNFFLNSISIGTGPELKQSGAAVFAGEFGGWTPIGAEQMTGGGYDVAYKLAGADQYTVWTTDSSGNYTSNSALVSGSSATLESYETVLHQDLNGDGIIGAPPQPSTVIEMFGATKLVEVGSNFFLDSISSGTDPELLQSGAPVVAGQFGGWGPIGAELLTGGGYDVAFKLAGADQYTVWTTDSNGNYITNSAIVSGSSSTLESYETFMHQDLNGDGLIGAPQQPSTVIEAVGATKLVEIGSNFFLDSISSETGPELQQSGAPVVAGQFGGWTPIGAEQLTGDGYDVAYKLAGADQYTVWTTDSSGNYTGNSAVVSGSSATLESYETVMHQDLNGDGMIGAPAPATTVIEAVGATKLVEVGSNFFLDSISNGTGPELQQSGAPVVAGQFGGWTPIGAEQITGGGYDVAYKLAGADHYTVWSTDSNGNYVTNSAIVSGSSATLESFETTFHQDLNGDGTIGITAGASAVTAQAVAAHSGQTTFDGTSLTLGAPSTFTGQIIGFAGNGSLAGSDQINLQGVHYNSIHSSYDSSTGILAVTDGTTTADLEFLGQYTPDNFKFADDGSGGVLVYGSPASGPSQASGGASPPAAPNAGPATASVAAGHDTFVFAPNFGQVTLTQFNPQTDTIQIGRSVFANMDTLTAAIHDDAHGNAVITDAAHDTVTIQNVTTAQLLAHQNDFHFV